ncbi:hypothetical protein LshimejAT787_0505570 [Lyophyllum shimeji]|uniref:Uncharacterized protein n=1 Tax=Lyophyllum shimeji TaxID=47721 RepID=A0A9P3PLT6_LYOSH|nr:hypothetical protein LshimejAT787_0505570 [Lyophyllum shimeji]
MGGPDQHAEVRGPAQPQEEADETRAPAGQEGHFDHDRRGQPINQDADANAFNDRDCWSDDGDNNKKEREPDRENGQEPPNAQHLKHVLEPSTKEMGRLKNGVMMDICGQDPDLVYADERLATQLISIPVHTARCFWLTSINLNHIIPTRSQRRMITSFFAKHSTPSRHQSRVAPAKSRSRWDMQVATRVTSAQFNLSGHLVVNPTLRSSVTASFFVVFLILDPSLRQLHHAPLHPNHPRPQTCKFTRHRIPIPDPRTFELRHLVLTHQSVP